MLLFGCTCILLYQEKNVSLRIQSKQDAYASVSLNTLVMVLFSWKWHYSRDRELVSHPILEHCCFIVHCSMVYLYMSLITAIKLYNCSSGTKERGHQSITGSLTTTKWSTGPRWTWHYWRLSMILPDCPCNATSLTATASRYDVWLKISIYFLVYDEGRHTQTYTNIHTDVHAHAHVHA